MKLLFLDESGDHNLNKIDAKYPMFVLGGVIVERDYLRTTLAPKLDAFKLSLFGRKDLILHTADISRAKNGFERLKNPVFRDQFYEELNELMRSLEYQIVACAIDKNAHKDKYGNSAYDPYHFSLEVLVERFCKEIGDIDDGGMIIAEKRRPDLDLDLEKAWLRLCRRGTYYLDKEVMNKRIVDLVIRDKKLNLAGLQLADLVVTTIGRHVLGKGDREDWQIVEEKFCRRLGRYQGAGLVVLPR